MIKEQEKGSSKATKEGSSSEAETREEVKQNNEGKDAQSSSKVINSQCERGRSQRRHFRRAPEEHEVTELKRQNR